METYNDWLMHYGRQGMKWGVMNGPPYPLGKTKAQRLKDEQKRLKEKKKEQDLKNKNDALRRQIKEEKEANRLANRSQKQIEKEKAEEARRIKKLTNASPRKLNDDDLDAALERRRKENQLREEDRKSIGSGKAFVKQMLISAGTIAAVTFVTKLATEKGMSYAHKWMSARPEKYVTYAGTEAKDAAKVTSGTAESIAKTSGAIAGILGLAKAASGSGKDKKNKG